MTGMPVMTAVVAAFLFGVFVGNVGGHNTVATECKRLNSFYVGDTVYQCQVKETTKP